MSVTIIDVAKKAGVSFKTVSRVMNGENSVRPATKEKVLAAAKSLDFKVNSAARALRSKRPSVVTLFLYNASRSYAQDVQIGAMAGCNELGLSLVIEDQMTDAVLDRLSRDETSAGVILITPYAHDQVILSKLDGLAIPYIRVGTEVELEGSTAVGMNDRKASRELTESMIALGHIRIAYITGPATHEVSRPRRLGYEDALKYAGIEIEPEYIMRGDFSYASGTSAAEAFLALPSVPTTIICANDEMAAGVLAAAYRHNVRIPEKLSVAGFDDSPIARVIYPSLTTIHQSTRDMTRRAVSILKEHIHEPTEGGDVERMPYQLVVRDSTGPAPS